MFSSAEHVAENDAFGRNINVAEIIVENDNFGKAERVVEMVKSSSIFCNAECNSLGRIFFMPENET